MLVYDFSDRAEECIRLAQRAKSPHDKELFVEMARAWFGVLGEQLQSVRTIPVPATH